MLRLFSRSQVRCSLSHALRISGGSPVCHRVDTSTLCPKRSVHPSAGAWKSGLEGTSSELRATTCTVFIPNTARSHLLLEFGQTPRIIRVVFHPTANLVTPNWLIRNGKKCLGLRQCGPGLDQYALGAGRRRKAALGRLVQRSPESVPSPFSLRRDNGEGFRISAGLQARSRLLPFVSKLGLQRVVAVLAVCDYHYRLSALVHLGT